MCVCVTPLQSPPTRARRKGEAQQRQHALASHMARNHRPTARAYTTWHTTYITWHTHLRRLARRCLAHGLRARGVGVGLGGRALGLCLLSLCGGQPVLGACHRECSAGWSGGRDGVRGLCVAARWASKSRRCSGLEQRVGHKLAHRHVRRCTTMLGFATGSYIQPCCAFATRRHKYTHTQVHVQVHVSAHTHTHTHTYTYLRSLQLLPGHIQVVHPCTGRLLQHRQLCAQLLGSEARRKVYHHDAEGNGEAAKACSCSASLMRTCSKAPELKVCLHLLFLVAAAQKGISSAP